VKKALFYIILISICTLSACSFADQQVVVDNPLNVTLAFCIDRDSFNITPHHFLELNIPRGTHIIQATELNSRATVLKKQQVDISGDGLLNIGKMPYVRWTNVYVKPGTDTAAFQRLIKSKKISLNGFEYDGDLELFPANQLFIARNWNLGLQQAFPSEMHTDQHVLLRSKIFRQDDFEAAFDRSTH
jgi:hypothetical protein